MKRTQGMLLEHLALVAKGNVFLVPTHLKQLKRQSLAGYHPQSTTQTPDYNASPVFMQKRPIFLSWSFRPQAQILGLPYIQRLQRYPQGTWLGRYNNCILLRPHQSLLISPRKELIHISEAMILATVVQRISPDLLL